VRCKLKSSRTKAGVAALLAGLCSGPLLACGPNFPNSFLDTGDQGLLVAPVADFSGELARLNLEPARFHAVTNGGTFAGEAAEAELRDLARALQPEGQPSQDSAQICARHRAEREKLTAYQAGVEKSQVSRPLAWDENTKEWIYGPPAVPPPEFPPIVSTAGLPEEFADYFEGAVAWANPALTNKEPAREAWRRLLSLPAPDRHYKATWAAFMLGKSLQRQDPARATAYFRRVRDLCEHGFVDSLGLAAASLGLEAQTEWQQGNTAGAMELYLEQFAAGDLTAANSLRRVASTVLQTATAGDLKALAADKRIERVITACLISRRRAGDLEEAQRAGRWLAAVEAAGVTDLESAEKLALAAYQAGEWEPAQRWLQRAPATPAAQWLQAKLWLRAGKVDQAAALLAKAALLFPLAPPATNAPAQFQDDLTVPGSTYLSGEITASRQVLGELGALRLARREYAEALDALLRSGFWMDAAYVAERVLTVDELKNYVDRNWPAAADVKQNSEENAAPNPPGDFARQIRHLLARRLARLHRSAEAREYYPAPWRPRADALARALAKGTDTNSPAEERAGALFDAALITQTNGMDLFGTETAPDWRIHDGYFEAGVTAAMRTNQHPAALRPSEDELRRAGESAAVPEARFHYRFQAAALAWQAALLMPDNSDQTARVLCRAGSWIKNLDAQKADVFYKALVRRCRKTAIGGQADRMRWFPVLDEAGNPLPFQPPTVK
jgi:hypothetical protein